MEETQDKLKDKTYDKITDRKGDGEKERCRKETACKVHYVQEISIEGFVDVTEGEV